VYKDIVIIFYPKVAIINLLLHKVVYSLTLKDQRAPHLGR
jgi:hypothetical protein